MSCVAKMDLPAVHGDTGKNGKMDCWLGKITGEQGYVQDYTLAQLHTIRMGIRAYGWLKKIRPYVRHSIEKTTIISLESCLQHVLLDLQLGLQLEIKSVENLGSDGKDIAIRMNQLIPPVIAHAKKSAYCPPTGKSSQASVPPRPMCRWDG